LGSLQLALILLATIAIAHPPDPHFGMRGA
jgi:hypothetical protein